MIAAQTVRLSPCASRLTFITPITAAVSDLLATILRRHICRSLLSIVVQVRDAQARQQRAEAASARAAEAEEAAKGEAQAALGRCSALETSSAAALATVQDLSAQLACAARVRIGVRH